MPLNNPRITYISKYLNFRKLQLTVKAIPIAYREHVHWRIFQYTKYYYTSLDVKKHAKYVKDM